MQQSEYTIDCKGDAVVGDEIEFQKAVFTGSFRNAKFSHYETIRGKIVKDSYGAKKQQHTFTIETADKTFRIKGRNLYAKEIMRKPWANESQRRLAQEEKHERGDVARRMREIRRQESFY